ncbi:Sugar transferase involved in LPS biosynthesis (colanic, teichoic acid) [Celeribacter baekdonensis]|uniref:Sugar transferase involved in LPS biosynthesis (Colanic, teichoic acid) n=1 Tax=Celeribacter baekdonensis TaxID=875171 RepID=A0A1G7TQ62_9RHOB|nr:sugar transferase [Celeribacter baekdonensis]SDG37477.1 Sugar transferase involved in LPS biosynthesis (colanic, teichoic acid) [Celeribacter baekdonensis]
MLDTSNSSLRSPVLAATATRADHYISQETAQPTRIFYRKYGKRIFDMLLLLIAAPIIVPVVLVLALLVKRDGGPAFFTQKRVGMNGKVFKCYKLRSMRVDAEEVLERLCREDPAVAEEWTTFQKLTNDPRITRIGHIIRATSLDELPQLLNVFRGDMSLIGPRPFMPSQMSIYTSAKGKAYFNMRPGLSGPWQVSGRGETTFADRVAFDEGYERDLSFATDVKLTWKTFAVVLNRTGH